MVLRHLETLKRQARPHRDRRLTAAASPPPRHRRLTAASPPPHRRLNAARPQAWTVVATHLQCATRRHLALRFARLLTTMRGKLGALRAAVDKKDVGASTAALTDARGVWDGAATLVRAAVPVRRWERELATLDSAVRWRLRLPVTFASYNCRYESWRRSTRQ